jgi:hypothetical protein
MQQVRQICIACSDPKLTFIPDSRDEALHLLALVPEDPSITL